VERLAQSLKVPVDHGMQALWLEESLQRIEAWRKGETDSLSEEEAMA